MRPVSSSIGQKIIELISVTCVHLLKKELSKTIEIVQLKHSLYYPLENKESTAA
jgi:hypothetical protein